ncbi:MAG TPA: hypothetical protein VJ813_16920 [Vicinamibacterales bacterium]|nr:hypothetical protein [Vicinamibacterales bacterium]
MTRTTIAAALFVTIPALGATQAPPVQVGSLTVAPPTRIGEIDRDKQKGQPSRLAWSADGTELYVQTMDGEFGKPGARLSHYVFKIENGNRREVQAEPEWVSAYWTAKSGQAAPDDGAFKIELKQEIRSQKTVSTPMGGDLARGGGVGGDGGTASSGDALAAAYNQQPVPVNTMVLHGEVVGEFVNSVIVPGLTFGWGPKGSKVIAYSAAKGGRLVIMNDQGKKQDLEGTKDALLPAWSPDGTRLAWLQKDGKKKYELKVARIN